MARSARADEDSVNGDDLLAKSRCPRVGVDRPELLSERSFSTSFISLARARGRTDERHHARVGVCRRGDSQCVRGVNHRRAARLA
jgi:hypothetical protein